jgi:sugar/nucleoside kinase (ribokinase family)
MTPPYDTFHMGRSSIDLYSDDIGAPFVAITRFAAFVGGSPTNISVGARRLGLRSALLTAVGADPVGDFVLHFLDKEGVETRYIPRKPGRRTSAVLLGIEPPDRFPLVYYRDNCADAELTIDDVLAAPIAQSKVFQFAGTNLAKEPARSATLFAAELARRNGVCVVLDLDFRPDQWHDPRAFGVAVRAALHTVDIVIGTDDELKATTLTDLSQVTVSHSQVSDARVAGDAEAAVQAHPRQGRASGGAQARRPGRAGVFARWRGGCAGLSGGGGQRPGRGRCLRRRPDLRLRAWLGLVSKRPAGQRLRRHLGHQARLRQLHAHTGGSDGVCRVERWVMRTRAQEGE